MRRAHVHLGGQVIERKRRLGGVDQVERPAHDVEVVAVLRFGVHRGILRLLLNLVAVAGRSDPDFAQMRPVGVVGGAFGCRAG